MFIQTEDTPNPNSMKFNPGEQVNPGEPLYCASVRESTRSPLAVTLFTIPEVESVFLGSDFITVTKKNDADWNLLKPEILTIIMDFFVSGKVILHEKAESSSDVTEDIEDGEYSAIVEQIKELIEQQVRPAVAQDGGDIIFRSFENGVVKLKLQGACSGCPSSTITLKNGIENMLKHYIPEVISVEAADE